ncbi:hypothetical protein COV53_04400 [Candidatus Gottesmanbacteria bacterium CG11_big_fil_rev_8_21_14_0_20_37_11]|uniref:Sulfatase N-terminal domain-containing protein n=3 Tax=Candidatus Gottesmaniibacteriota TaxID=1752720 RepID=A0A2M7RS41_9BACT|nr:MAG: hypothetical protein AUJ73_04460 [Candidatus Gottesmanbacteria bacterium CG1_02_37_22]PIP32703.1 MAG: hypothetical protein COX23_03445 [Candidatus Gottesmanbacteria bacterium CG23_combo_of_CG06-09_8_20_14_all_37_19]PIR08178.1 MAG: hypothetical protein COV53_04400 [Candidatus Gottesmanbacteria bacterium CG11_big_fil_rev_8_21_14_0_20_37_11]PIZ03112.1 MAG: hypothetical protein COY59_01230 [Candidatus Gottesmanbacteria bacterium CG_4_10_14_0_8_um_filter_37_24]
MKNMRKITKSITFIPFAPILFSLSFVLILFAHNIGELTLPRILVPLLITFLFSLIVYFFTIIILRNINKSIIYSSIFLIIFFSYRDVVFFTGSLHILPWTIDIGSNHVMFLVLVILLLYIYLLIKRAKRSFILLSRYLTIIAVISTLIPLSGIMRYEIIRKLQKRPDNPLVLSKIDSISLDKNILPDIYYIVPDSYTSTGNLKKYFNYDNSQFVSFLEDMGFYVATQSSSNYPKTFLSLSSSLNMEYLDYLSVNINSNDQTLTDRLIENNNVVRLLKSLGYHYYQMGSWWGSTHFSRLADENYIIEKKVLGGIGEFNYMLINSSMLSPFISRFIPKAIVGESDDDKRARILYQFEELPNVATLPGPKFVFTHIIAPHGPYVFGKNCEYVSYELIREKSEEENYANQVSCINHKLEEAIRSIIKNGAKPPVILLQADEGPNLLNGKLIPPDNWKEANKDLMREKFPILSAYYLPGVSKSILYPSITPVNSFRAIFNLYFSANLSLLPDRNYVFLDTNHLYEFEDVTEDLED